MTKTREPKLYRVATYFHRGLKLQVSNVSTYLRDWSAEWKGYEMIEVEAKSSTEAKRLAARERISREGARIEADQQ